MAKGFASKIPPIKNDDVGLLVKWSYSQWSDYEKCPAKVKYKQIMKYPEPPAPALARGVTAHKIPEDIINGVPYEDAVKNNPVPGKPCYIASWAPKIIELRDQKASPEAPYAVNREWGTESWFSPRAWLRGKLDARVPGKIIDFKTGQRYAEHAYQADLYATLEFATTPNPPEKVVVEFWYFDEPYSEEALKTYTFEAAKQADRIAGWEHRVSAMMNDTIFPHRPGNHCRWCSFSNSKGGPCVKG